MAGISSICSNPSDHPGQTTRSVYIHVPFCRHKCGYCDFTLVAGRDDLFDRYLAALAREFQLHGFDPSQPTEVDTLFLGGGTPTHPTVSQLRALLELIRAHFPVGPGAEFSVEANPLDLTDEKIELLSDFGVNRLSLGVQALRDDLLTLLERDHRAGQIGPLLERVRPKFASVSIDLMFGIPGQTLNDWEQSIREVVAYDLPHVSTYGLTWEPNTAFSTRLKRGELHRADDGLEGEMYLAAMEFLGTAGYRHYEISNFARPGFECRHHLVYWNGGDYEAFGPSAARHRAGRRETNVRSVLGWLSAIESGRSVVGDAEDLDSETRARELIMLQLRLDHGVIRDAFSQQTGYLFDELAAGQLADLVASGLLEDTGDAVRLTRSGKLLGDRVAAAFL